MMKFNTDKKMEEEREKYKVYCKHCGHTMFFYPFENKTKKICSWCKNSVYNNDTNEFKDKLNRMMKK